MITYQKGDILAIYNKLMGIATRYSRKKKWKKAMEEQALEEGTGQEQESADE